ncbi:hypothetical protein BLOT_006261 [Blomia tropicalis]|nr:hypothetical protein BLOT_006261 [Blomia tropicalis]
MDNKYEYESNQNFNFCSYLSRSAKPWCSGSCKQSSLAVKASAYRILSFSDTFKSCVFLFADDSAVIAFVEGAIRSDELETD